MPTKGSGNRSAEKLGLDQFLNSKSIHNLQNILSFWSAEAHPWYSKSILIRDLRRLMLDKEVLEEKLNELAPMSVSQLRCLIKGIPFEMYPGGQSTFIDQLARTGFVKRSLGVRAYEDQTPPVVPEELKPLLIEALDIDMRPVAEVISLKGFLNSMPGDQYRTIVAKALHNEPGAGTHEAHYRLLTEPDRVLARIGKLPERLRNNVIHAVNNSGGVCAVELVAGMTAARIKKLLEEQLIGTVTELPINADGFAHQVMLVFTDITEKLLCVPPGPLKGYEKVSTNGIAALVDMNTILQFLSLEGARVKQNTALYKSSINRLAGLMGPTEAPTNKERSVRIHLTLLHKLGLADERRGEVVPTEKADDWLNEEPEDQLAAVIGKLDEIITPMNRYAWGKLINILRTLPVGEAYPANLMLSSMLLSFFKDLGAGKKLWEFLHTFEDLHQVLDVAVDWLQTLEGYGIVDSCLKDETLLGVRLTDPGAMALGAPVSPQADEAEGRVLIVNPDFECIIFKHGPAWRVVATVSRFARREKADQTYHFKIERRHVETAALCGMSGDSMVSFLRDHSRAPVPQNVEYSVKDWASKVRVALSFSAVILETEDSHTLDTIMEDPQIKPHIARRLSPTLAALNDRITDKKLINHLRQHGIFLKN